MKSTAGESTCPRLPEGTFSSPELGNLGLFSGNCGAVLFYCLVFFFCFFFCSVLLSFVSGEDTQDRTDRVMLTPWVKFLWEAYRNVLELLRNNARVEKLYHDTAQQGRLKHLKLNNPSAFRNN